MPLSNGKVDASRGQVEILRTGGGAFRVRFISCDRVLRKPHTIEGVHVLKLVLAREVEDDARGIALQGLRSGLLEVNVAGQSRGAEQVLLSCEQEFGLISTAAQFRRLLLNGLRWEWKIDGSRRICCGACQLCSLHSSIGRDVSRG